MKDLFPIFMNSGKFWKAYECTEIMNCILSDSGNSFKKSSSSELFDWESDLKVVLISAYRSGGKLYDF
jgi:hypothetical protein